MTSQNFDEGNTISDVYYCIYCGCRHSDETHRPGSGHSGHGSHGGHGGHSGHGGHGGHGGHSGHGGHGHPGHGHGYYGGGIFGPWGLPLPIPIPIPYPQPQYPDYPIQQPVVTVVINGYPDFPGISNRYTIVYQPGMSIFNALTSTGVIGFTSNQQISSISGIPIGGAITYQLSLNGRPLSSSLMNYPVNPNDTIGINVVNRV